MRFRHAMLALILTAVTLLSACGGNKQPVEPRTSPVNLDEVRRFAGKAVNGTFSSDERQQARDAAVRGLVDLLKTPEGARIAKAEWEKPVTTGSGPMVRVFELGKARVFGFPLPGPGVVPPGERVFVQYIAAGGAPLAAELPTMPGGTLSDVKLLEESSQVGLSAAFTLARGGGYVAHYLWDAKAGEFKPTSSPLKGLPSKVGDLTLELRDQFLLVNLPNPDDWRPRFDAKQPLRLFLNSDIALDWKTGKYAVLDERNFSAFDGFKTALDPKTAKKEREEAWEKATRKLPGYLEEMASWNEDLLPKLPSGATQHRDQSSNLAVRVVSIPGPEGQPGFTVLQYRAGSGLPQAQSVKVNGKVDAVRITFRQGLPSLMLLSTDVSAKGSKRMFLTVLRQTAGNDWEPSPESFGWTPSVDGWQFQLDKALGSLEISHDAKPGEFTATIAAGADPGLTLCPGSGAGCQMLSWVGDRLTGSGWALGKLKLLTGAGASPTRDQVMQAAGLVQAFLSAPENAQLTGAQISAALGGLVQTFEPAPGTRVIAFPDNSSGVVPVLVQSGTSMHIEVTNPDVVDRWTDARIVQAGTEQRLLVLGRGRVTAALVAFQREGDAWKPVDPVLDRVDRNVAERVRVSYAPGQTTPVRGLYVFGSAEITASFTPDGKGVTFCEGKRGCLTYTFDKQWVLR